MAAALAASERFYNCFECKKAGLDKNRFCDKDAPYPIVEINGQEYFRCPVQFVTAASLEALSSYQFYKEGFLPTGGGYLDQPNRIMEQMLIISHQVNEEMENRRKR